MNKKIKIIDLLNKIVNGEKLPEKILILDDVYYLITSEDNEKVYSQSKDERNWQAFIDHKLNITRCLDKDVMILNDEVEILEDNTEEIEKSNFEDMGYEIAQAYFEFYKGIAKALTEKGKEKSNE